MQYLETQRQELLAKVAQQFKSYDFVKSIEIIPSNYLTPAGGFENLNQLRAMFDVDVIALVSYDQVQSSSAGIFSVAYLTVVGRFIIPGNNNDTHTMMDAVVYDIPSRKLLFRAPGVSSVPSTTTPINADKNKRLDRDAGFDQASTNMVANLQQELTKFRERVKESPEEFKIVRSPGYTGRGASGVSELAELGLLLTAGFLFRRS
jgi:rhombotail lipoprotein